MGPTARTYFALRASLFLALIQVAWSEWPFLTSGKLAGKGASVEFLEATARTDPTDTPLEKAREKCRAHLVAIVDDITQGNTVSTEQVRGTKDACFELCLLACTVKTDAAVISRGAVDQLMGAARDKLLNHSPLAMQHAIAGAMHSLGVDENLPARDTPDSEGSDDESSSSTLTSSGDLDAPHKPDEISHKPDEIPHKPGSSAQPGEVIRPVPSEEETELANLLRMARADGREASTREGAMALLREAARAHTEAGPSVDAPKAPPVSVLKELGSSDVQPLDRAHEMSLAMEKGYGHKAANLIVIEEFLQTTSTDFGEFQVAVPYLHGIPHPSVLALLGLLGLDLQAVWTNAVDTTEGALAAAKVTYFAIKKAFASSKLAKMEKAIEKEAGTFLQGAGKSGDRIMVRSTGMEDTEDVANAGGNASVLNLDPSSAEVTSAVGVVVASYFSQKSFMQRQAAGEDADSLSRLPLVGVLLQVMKAENAGVDANTHPHDVYRSGVAYSREPSMAAAGAGDQVSFAVLQASYGHNEGVVSSQVVVDTYYAHTTLDAVFPVIRRKLERLSPSAKGGVIPVENPRDMQLASTLTPSMIHTLTMLTEALHRFYGGEMIRDIEFTVDPHHKIVYVLQCRPLALKAVTLTPQYISNAGQGALDDQAVFRASTIVSASAAVTIAQAHNIISASNLRVALAQWGKRKEKTDIKVVMTGKLAPSTSHESVEFRVRGIQVVHVPWADRQVLNDLSQKGHTLAFDVQNELIVTLPDKHAVVNLERTIKDGWISYPLSPVVSLTLATPDGQYADADGIATETELIREAVLSHPTLRGDSALASLVGKHASMWNLALATLAAAYTESIKMGDTRQADTLFARRMLEALTFQEVPSASALDAWSAVSISKILDDEERLRDSFIGVSPVGRQLGGLASFALATTTQEKFQEFAIASSREPPGFVRAVARGALALLHVGSMPYWTNTLFPHITNEAACAQLRKLEDPNNKDVLFLNYIESNVAPSLDSLDPSGFGDLTTVNRAYESAKEAAHQLDEAHVGTLFAEGSPLSRFVYLSAVSTFVESFDGCLKAFKQSPDTRPRLLLFAKLQEVNSIAFRFVDKVLDPRWDHGLTLFGDTVDLGWPSLVCASGLHYDRYFVKVVKDHCGGYRDSLEEHSAGEGSVGRAPSTLPASSDDEIDESSVASVEAPELKRVFNKKTVEDCWHMSDSFDVGQTTCFSMHDDYQDRPEPITLEEVFTSQHQSMVVVLDKVLDHTALVKNLALPDRLQEFLKLVAVAKSKSRFQQAPKCVNSLRPGGVTIACHLPMRSHSASLKLNYKTGTGDIVVEYSAIGTEVNCRWAMIGRLLYDMGQDSINGVKSSGVGSITDNRMKAQFIITSEATAKDLASVAAIVGTYITNLTDQFVGDIEANDIAYVALNAERKVRNKAPLPNLFSTEARKIVKEGYAQRSDCVQIALRGDREWAEAAVWGVSR